MSVILDFVQEDNTPVRHKTSVHSRNTRLSDNSETAATGDRGRNRAGGRRRPAALTLLNTVRTDRRVRLAPISAVSIGVTAESIRRATFTESETSADINGGISATASAIRGSHTAGSDWRSDWRSNWGSSSGTSRDTSVRGQTVTRGGTTISILTTASSKGRSSATSTSESGPTSTIGPGNTASRRSRRGYWRSTGTSGDATSPTVRRRITAPSILLKENSVRILFRMQQLKRTYRTAAAAICGSGGVTDSSTIVRTTRSSSREIARCTMGEDTTEEGTWCSFRYATNNKY